MNSFRLLRERIRVKKKKKESRYRNSTLVKPIKMNGSKMEEGTWVKMDFEASVVKHIETYN